MKPLLPRCRGGAGHRWLPLRDLGAPPGHGHLLLWCLCCGLPVDWTNARRIFAHEEDARRRGVDSYSRHHPVADEQRGGGERIGPMPLNGQVKEAARR